MAIKRCPACAGEFRKGKLAQVAVRERRGKVVIRGKIVCVPCFDGGTTIVIARDAAPTPVAKPLGTRDRKALVKDVADRLRAQLQVRRATAPESDEAESIAHRDGWIEAMENALDMLEGRA